MVQSGLFGPLIDGLGFDGDAGGVADEAIVAGKMWPGFLDRGDIFVPLEALEFAAQLAGLGSLGVVDVFGGGGGFVADVASTEHGRLGATAADREVEQAVLADRGVGDGQRRTEHEIFANTGLSSVRMRP